MQALAERYITLEEYRAHEESSPVRHEYFDGRIYAMSGGSDKHAILCLNIAGSFLVQLALKPCIVVGGQLRVRIEATGLLTYPDVSVYCPPARFSVDRADELLNPKVLVEVLSPSTAAYDKGKKFDNYKQLEALCDYLLVSQNEVRVDHYHRLENGDWLLHTALDPEETIALDVIGCNLALRDVYAKIIFPAEVEPLRDIAEDTEILGLI